jgi:hypothetical protein
MGTRNPYRILLPLGFGPLTVAQVRSLLVLLLQGRALSYLASPVFGVLTRDHMGMTQYPLRG